MAEELYIATGFTPRSGLTLKVAMRKGTVAKMSPWGELLLEVQLHGAHCTNITSGGSDGRTAYVTVADTGNIERFRVEARRRHT